MMMMMRYVVLVVSVMLVGLKENTECSWMHVERVRRPQRSSCLGATLEPPDTLANAAPSAPQERPMLLE
jgi:hypothetical protein